MVRLKEFRQIEVDATVTNFNSNMVRLKVWLNTKSCKYICEFQFQYGAIKGIFRLLMNI